jgi:hypothetical protein
MTSPVASTDACFANLYFQKSIACRISRSAMLRLTPYFIGGNGTGNNSFDTAEEI